MNTRTHPGRTSQIFRNGIPFAQIHVPNLVVGADGDSQLATRNFSPVAGLGEAGIVRDHRSRLQARPLATHNFSQHYIQKIL